MGTREHIISYLAEVDELYDANGMASTRLAAAVGYPGSSVAFAQLLSGMERSGLIRREVRGKRTYRISRGQARAAGPGHAGAPGADGAPGTGLPGTAEAPRAAGTMLGVGAAFGTAGAGGAGGGPGASGGGAGLAVAYGTGLAAGAAGFDYDELARRLLVQVVQRLAAADPETSKLAEENVRLRQQLKAAQRSLAMAAEQVRSLPASTGLDSSEVLLLQRLLAPGEAGSVLS